MDDIKEMLRTMLARVDESSKDPITFLESQVKELLAHVKEFRRDTHKRLETMEERIEYLADKWVQHDQGLFRLRRRRG